MIDPAICSLEALFNDMAERKVAYAVIANFSYGSSCYVKIEGKYDGVEIKCKETVQLKDERVSAGIRRAYTKFLNVAGAGAPAMLAPPIEAQPARITASDDLSF